MIHLQNCIFNLTERMALYVIIIIFGASLTQLLLNILCRTQQSHADGDLHSQCDDDYECNNRKCETMLSTF